MSIKIEERKVTPIEERLSNMEQTLEKMFQAFSLKLDTFSGQMALVENISNELKGNREQIDIVTSRLETTELSVKNLGNEMMAMKQDLSENDATIKSSVLMLSEIVANNKEHEATIQKLINFENQIVENDLMIKNSLKQVHNPHIVLGNNNVLSSVDNAFLRALKDLKWKEVKRKSKDLIMKWVFRVQNTLSLFRSLINITQWNTLKNEALTILFEDTPHIFTGISKSSIEQAWDHFKSVEGLTQERLNNVIIASVIEYERSETYLKDDMVKLSGLIEFACEKNVLLPSVSYLKVKVRDWIPTAYLTNAFRYDEPLQSATQLLEQMRDQIMCLDSSVKGKKIDEPKPTERREYSLKNSKIDRPKHVEKEKQTSYIDGKKWNTLTPEEKAQIINERRLK